MVYGIGTQSDIYGTAIALPRVYTVPDRGFLLRSVFRYTVRGNVGSVYRTIFGTGISVPDVVGYSESESSWV